MKKIAFFDIDGTLIHVPQGLNRPTPVTIKTLHDFRKDGNYCVIATARGSVPESFNDIEFDGYICNDGHYIRFQGETLIDDLFYQEELEKLVSVLQKYDGRYMLSGHEYVWNSYVDDEMIIKHRMMFSGTKKISSNTIVQYRLEDVKAIACCVLFETDEQLMNAYELLKDDFTMVCYHTGLIRMDIYRKGYTKGTACRYLYEKLGIAYDDTYAFGDGVNDIEMIQNVKYGFAMGNGVDMIKEKAYAVIPSVMEEGISKAFYHFVDKNYGIK